MKPRFASSRNTVLASPRQPIAEMTTEESRTATGFIPLQQFPSDTFHFIDNFLNRGRAIGAVLLVHSIKIGFKRSQFLLAFTADKVSNHIAGGGKAPFFLARLYPRGLLPRQRDIQCTRHANMILTPMDFGKIQ